MSRATTYPVVLTVRVRQETADALRAIYRRTGARATAVARLAIEERVEHEVAAKARGVSGERLMHPR